MGWMLHVNLITPQKKFINVKYLIILALLASFKAVSYIFPVSKMRRGAGFSIYPSMYCHKPFILQKP